MIDILKQIKNRIDKIILGLSSGEILSIYGICYILIMILRNSVVAK
jgi:hypothetical protein